MIHRPKKVDPIQMALWSRKSYLMLRKWAAASHHMHDGMTTKARLKANGCYQCARIRDLLKLINDWEYLTEGIRRTTNV